MTSLEDEVGRVFRHVADTVPVPAPPTGLLVATGEAGRKRGRRRTTLLVAAAVVSVLAGTSWIVLDQHRGDPPPVPTQSPSVTPTPTPPANPAAALDALPQGGPPALPYLSKHALHVDGIEIPTSGDRLYASGDTILVQRWSGTDPSWWRLEGHHLVTEPALQGVFEPKLSPSGDLVVWWTNPTRSTTRVVAWDPRSRHEVDRVDLALPRTCCDGGSLLLAGVDGRDDVFWSEAHGYQVWRPGHGSPVAFGHPLGEIAPGGPVLGAKDGSEAVGEVDPNGRWTRTASLPSGLDTVWSPDGSLIAYTGESVSEDYPKVMSPAVWARDVRTRKDEVMAVPPGVDIDLIGFEGSTSMLLEAYLDPRHSYVLRCDVTTGACERALSPGTTPTEWRFQENF